MKKEYLIKLEVTGKYNIYYFINDVQDSVEYYGRSLDAPELEIRIGYTKNIDSL